MIDLSDDSDCNPDGLFRQNKPEKLSDNELAIDHVEEAENEIDDEYYAEIDTNSRKRKRVAWIYDKTFSSANEVNIFIQNWTKWKEYSNGKKYYKCSICPKCPVRIYTDKLNLFYNEG